MQKKKEEKVIGVRKGIIVSTLLFLILLAVPLCNLKEAKAQSIYQVTVPSGVTAFTISYGNYRAYYISSTGAIKQLQIYQLAFTDGTPLNYLYVQVPNDMASNKIYFVISDSQISYSQARLIDKSQGAYYNYNVTLVLNVFCTSPSVNVNFTRVESTGTLFTNNFVNYRASVSGNKLIVTLNYSLSATVSNYVIKDYNVIPSISAAPPSSAQVTLRVYDVSKERNRCTGFTLSFIEVVLRSDGSILNNGAVAFRYGANPYVYTRTVSTVTLTQSTTSATFTYSNAGINSAANRLSVGSVSLSYSFSGVYVTSVVELNYLPLEETQGIKLDTSTYNIVVKKTDVTYTIQNYRREDVYPLILVYRGTEPVLSVYRNGYFYNVYTVDLLDNTKLIFANTLMTNASTVQLIHNYEREGLKGLSISQLSRDRLLTYLYIKNGSVVPQSNSIYYNAWLQNHDKWLILQCANGASTSAIRLSAIGYDVVIVPPFREFRLNAYVYSAYLLETSIQFTIQNLMGYTVTYTQSSTDYYYVAIEEVSYTPTPVGSFKYRLTVTINLQSLPQDMSEKGFVFCLTLPKGLIISENAFKDVVVTDTAYQPFPTAIEYIDNEKVVIWFRYPYPLLYNAFNVYILSGSKTLDMLVSLSNVFDNVYTSGIMKNDMGLYSLPLLDKYNLILLKGVSKFGFGKLNDYLMFYNNTCYEVHGTYIANSFPVDFKANINNIVYVDRTFTVVSLYKDFSGIASYILQNYNVEKAEYFHFSDGVVYFGRLIPYNYYVLEVHGTFTVPKAQSPQSQTMKATQTTGFDWGTLWTLMPMLFVLVVLAIVIRFIKGGGGSGGLLQRV